MRILSNFSDRHSDLTVTGFTFPNLTVKNCVVESSVRWDGLRFVDTGQLYRPYSKLCVVL